MIAVYACNRGIKILKLTVYFIFGGILLTFADRYKAVGQGLVMDLTADLLGKKKV